MRSLVLINSNYFHKIDTPEKAYWLGFILGDGYIYQETNNSWRLGIELNIKDITHLEKFSKAVGLNFNHIYKRKNRNTVALRWSSVDMKNDLLILGVTPRKSLTAKWPVIPKKYEIHMLRGLFDADGCICGHHKSGYIYPRFNVIGTKNCMNNIRRILKIDNKVYEKSDCPIWVIEKNGYIPIRKIYSQLYKNATVWLDRKREKFEIFYPAIKL